MKYSITKAIGISFIFLSFLLTIVLISGNTIVWIEIWPITLFLVSICLLIEYFLGNNKNNTYYLIASISIFLLGLIFTLNSIIYSRFDYTGIWIVSSFAYSLSFAIGFWIGWLNDGRTEYLYEFSVKTTLFSISKLFIITLPYLISRLFNSNIIDLLIILSIAITGVFLIVLFSKTPTSLTLPNILTREKKSYEVKESTESVNYTEKLVDASKIDE